MWMSPQSFKYLLNVVGPVISKKDTRFRKAISPSERLCLTLHYLAYGESQQSLSFSFQIAKSTVNNIINETCSAIWECLQEQYVRPPRTVDDWKKIAKEFLWDLEPTTLYWSHWWKHVRIKAPINSGSLYYNYKDFHSIVLMYMMLAMYFHLSILGIMYQILIVACSADPL